VSGLQSKRNSVCTYQQDCTTRSAGDVLEYGYAATRLQAYTNRGRQHTVTNHRWQRWDHGVSSGMTSLYRLWVRRPRNACRISMHIGYPERVAMIVWLDFTLFARGIHDMPCQACDVAVNGHDVKSFSKHVQLKPRQQSNTVRKCM